MRNKKRQVIVEISWAEDYTECGLHITTDPPFELSDQHIVDAVADALLHDAATLAALKESRDNLN